ncbi:cyclic lactone autoinducer peptide [Anaerovorax odorimutans]|uniref:cyclic lactone autoinducer peptide n=1 Tax=Anaerovorax odorimutans TaxID=109327 RepID=UPI003B50833B
MGYGSTSKSINYCQKNQLEGGTNLKTILSKIAFYISSLLVFIANISISTTTFCLWYEPNCPEILLNK